jgi:uncharacterized membrane protein
MLIAGLAIFLGVHLLPALPRIRQALLERLGEQRYKSVFSVVSALGLALIVAGYVASDDRSRVFAPNPAARAVAPWAVTLSFILFAAANMRGHLRRILGHPMLIGLIVWSLVHLLANGDRTGTVLFGAFLAYALIDLASAVHRGARRRFEPQLRYDGMAIVGGVVVALTVMTIHRLLFGVAVVPFGI